MLAQLQSLSPSAVLLLLSVHLHGVSSQITTAANGAAQFSGTPVLANPIGVPTLVYNCAKMPSICNNVHANGGSYQLTDLGNSLKGRLVTGTYVTLHVDPDSTRGTARRAQSCPSNWKQNHVCPETGTGGRDPQPLVVPEPFNVGGRTVSTGFVGEALNAAGFDYHILDPSGALTGMAWTCDEFPPAFSIEGGLNSATNTLASTYCAPQTAVDCDGRYTRSEQDFQSSAHGRIQTAVVAAGPLNYQDGIFEFHFITEFVDEDDAYATRVDWYEPSSQFGVFYGQDENIQKRHEWKVLKSHRFHGNGSVLELQRQVEMDHGTPNGRNEIDAFIVSGPRPTTTRYFAEVTAAPELHLRRDACSLPEIETLTDGTPQYAPTSIDETFATFSCSVQSVATMVGYS